MVRVGLMFDVLGEHFEIGNSVKQWLRNATSPGRVEFRMKSNEEPYSWDTEV